MIDLAQLDDLARRLGGLLPPSLREGRDGGIGGGRAMGSGKS